MVTLHLEIAIVKVNPIVVQWKDLGLGELDANFNKYKFFLFGGKLKEKVHENNDMKPTRNNSSRILTAVKIIIIVNSLILPELQTVLNEELSFC